MTIASFILGYVIKPPEILLFSPQKLKCNNFSNTKTKTKLPHYMKNCRD